MSGPGKVAIQFRCPHCTTLLGARRRQAGQRRRCPCCHRTLTVPTPEEAEARAARARATGAYELSEDGGRQAQARTYIPVNCPVCQTKLYATPEEVGTQLTCPDCFTEVSVPPLQTMPLEEGPADEKTAREMARRQDEYSLLDVDEDWAGRAAKEKPYIGLKCSLCGTRLLATEEQIGHQIVCPDCHQPTVVRAPPPAPPPPEPDIARHEEYEAGPPPPEVDYSPYLEDVVRRGQQRLAEEDQLGQLEADWQPLRSRKPPKWLFRDGVVRFLGDRRAVKGWMTIAGCITGIAVASSVSSWLMTQTSSPVYYLGLIMAALSLATAIACFPLLAPLWLNVVHQTAEGCDRIEDWGESEWLEGLLQSLYIIIPFLVSGLPGALLARAVGANMLTAMILGHTTALVLFPAVLLSALEEGAPWVPVSAKVFGVIPSTWRAWAGFHLRATPLVVGYFALCCVAGYAGWAGEVLMAALFIPTTMIYFRLLGRLAWFCSNREADEGTPPPWEDGEPAGEKADTD